MTTTATHLTHIALTTVYVTDQDKALDFYVNKLGFEKRREQHFGPGIRWIEVAIPGTQTAITLYKAEDEEDRAHLGKPTKMVLATDDVQAAYEALKAQGVHFTEAPTLKPWGRKQALFVDQDQNGFSLVER